VTEVSGKARSPRDATTSVETRDVGKSAMISAAKREASPVAKVEPSRAASAAVSASPSPSPARPPARQRPRVRVNLQRRRPPPASNAPRRMLRQLKEKSGARVVAGAAAAVVVAVATARNVPRANSVSTRARQRGSPATYPSPATSSHRTRETMR
jgi:hypothetical protein